jgi:hypothetical protein
MKYSEAEEIIEKFVEVLAIGTKTNDIARYQSLLPCSKDKIFDAFKIFLANAIKFNSFPSNILDNYIAIVPTVNQFIDDDIADILNEMHKLKDLKLISQDKEKARIYFDNRTKLFSTIEYNNILDFISGIKKLRNDDPQYCKKIYDLAGLRYYPDYEKDFN